MRSRVLQKGIRVTQTNVHSCSVTVTKTKSVCVCLSPNSMWARLRGPCTALGCSSFVSSRNQSQ